MNPTMGGPPMGMGMTPDPTMMPTGLPPTEMMTQPGNPGPGDQVPPSPPNPLLAILLQLLAPSLNAAANTIGQPPALGGMPPGGMMPSLGESMQAQPTMPPPMMY